MPLCLLCLLLLHAGIAFGQAAKDSLSLLLRSSAEDSATVALYYAYGETMENSQPDSAVYYYQKARSLASKIGYTRGVASFSSYYIVILNNRGQFREALQVAEEALDLYNAFGNKKELSTANLNVGSEWHYLSDFVTASEYYLKAKQYAEETGDLRSQRIANNNLASVFIQMGEYEKGKAYAEKALSIAGDLKNDYAAASSLINIATASMQLLDHEKALKLYREVEAIGYKIKDESLLLDGWLGVADAYNALNRRAEAERYYGKVVSSAVNAPEYMMYANMGLADLFLKHNETGKAEANILKGIKLALGMGSRLELKDLYLKASELNEKKGSLAAALEFRKKFEVLNDSILGEQSRLQVSNLEVKYEFDQKESTIRRLESERQVQQLMINKKNLWNSILIGGTTALFLVLILGFRNYQNRQKIQHHRIQELETEKKLSVTQAVLKGEEQERVRLAKDLHDGLGGMLSGVKFSLSNIKEHLVLRQDDARAFERSLNMLDSSIREMRRVAHNMMPESLVKFGLDAALRDFCGEIDRSGVLRVNYQSIGIKENPPEQPVAVAVFRVTQELLHNIVKHAEAKSAIVQIAKTDQVLSITVEDDGKGFDLSRHDVSDGIGWKNINSRIQFINGKIDVNSAPDRGTSVLIEIPV